jgi:hypothetical protein
MSEDPKLFDAGDYNLFRYCHNDPIDFTDPMGLENRADQAQPDGLSHDREGYYTNARVVLAAWADSSNKSPGQFSQFASDHGLTMGLGRRELEGKELKRTIDALQAGVKRYAEIAAKLKNYPPLQPIVDALRNEADFREGEAIQFSGRDNPFVHPTDGSKIIYYNPKSKLRSFAPELAHDGQHLVDRGTDGRYARERRAYNVTHGVGVAVGPPRPRLTDAQVNQTIEDNK